MGDFPVLALLAGAGVALVAGPFGCIAVWRRMAFFGGALAHAALLGVALGLLLDLDPTIGIFAVAFATAATLALLDRQKRIAGDTMLGIIAHAALALGLVVLSFRSGPRIDLEGYLFGGILTVTPNDVLLILGVAGLALGALVAIWRPLLAATVHEELAAIEGVAVARTNMIFMLVFALVVAIAIKVVGILLVVSLIILPAAIARRFAHTPEAMAVGAAVAGVAASCVGMGAAALWGTPAGPSIVVAASGLFLLAWLLPIGRSA